MKLRRPTDFLILEALHTHGRNIAPNIAERTGKSRKNVNNRLPVLADYGLVRKVGPADRSGLYEITDQGVAALELRSQYETVEDFSVLIDRRINATTSGPAQVPARGDTEEDETAE